MCEPNKPKISYYGDKLFMADYIFCQAKFENINKCRKDITKIIICKEIDRSLIFHATGNSSDLAQSIRYQGCMLLHGVVLGAHCTRLSSIMMYHAKTSNNTSTMG